MNKQQIINQIKAKKSFLCVGLDTDIKKIPQHLLNEEDPVFAFNKSIIDATAEYAVAYKPNTAFYEVYGAKGWHSLEKTINYIKDNYPEIFVIADAKRGDIGNTSANYARAFFETWVVLLALTSNKGSKDFQYLNTEGKELYKNVLMKSQEWADDNKMMYVVGATHPEELGEIRKMLPNHFFLVPGVGAQGGDLQAVARHGLNGQIGLLVNSSRGIIYASNGEDFAEKAAGEAKKLQQQMEELLKADNLI